jgi:hypothetical protein
MVRLATQKSEFENPICIATDDDYDDAERMFWGRLFSQDMYGENGSKVPSTKYGVTVNALVTHGMLILVLMYALMVKIISGMDISSHITQEHNSHKKLVKGPY